MVQMNKIVIKESAIHGCSIVAMVVAFIRHGNAVRYTGFESYSRLLKSFSDLDGDYDCNNKADEENCNTTTSTNLPNVPDIMIPTCHDWMFRCQNERCVPYWWKCDGNKSLK